MRFVFRWGLRLFLALAALAVAIAALAWYLAMRSLPDYDDSFTLSGISAPVEIVRDTYAVPHVVGQSDEDVFFGLGFAHAQDRLWQMTMFRRTAQGRLSELFGERTAGLDDLLLRLGLYRAAEASVAAQTPRTRRALEAYAAGVNAWIDQVNDRALGRGAPEFFLFGADVARWRPADSLAVMKLMGLQLSTHLSAEVTRARVALALPPGRVDDLLAESPQAVAALGDFASLFPAGAMPDAPVDLAQAFLSPLPAPGAAGASNAWAAAGGRSASGAPILANDPHLELTAPSIWYLAELQLPSGGVIGGTIPGMPNVFIGRNGDFAWGLTSAYLDDQDLHIEEVNPEDSGQYRGLDGWLPFETEQVILRVKNAAPRTLTLRRTENGPVLPGSVYDLAAVTPPGHVMSLNWTVLDPADTTMSAALALMRSRSVAEATEAAAGIVAPAQVLTMADRNHIGMQLIGRQPARDPRHETRGRLPSRGWIAENRWQGTLPYEDNPRFLDPAGGILGNTNNRFTDAPFPRHVSFTWGDTQRVQRWQRLMQAREVHTRDSFIEAQLDTVSVSARTLLPLVAADLWYTADAAAEGTPGRRRRQALDLLADWNGEMNEHLPEPLIYMAWMRALQQRLIEDDLGGPLAAQFAHVEPLFLERVFRNVDGAAAWCDVVQSRRAETCAEMARLSLDDALVWLDETYGGTLESLRWGDAHEARHDHPVLGQVPVLDWLVNIRQSTSGGDQTLARGQTAGTGPDPFANVHASGYRGVYDLNDPNASMFVIATGQSGHPLSRHYDDLGELWRRGEYIPMTLDLDLARAGAEGTVWLRPEELR
ncbi:penicillin acylase family protein [Mangrovicoccus algicola]|uniref:Penicillin acylase family protein n=1 Tax=Mangrovicoccus algicola TaxID=2771008 RepID=A0A8J6YYR2_9RHOB|nr:penicillin acylase family protein [Mangrovicoccus algicola]MBE3638481.1 penicillin acylase family protein [Mangrovicoccus algicola]